MKQVILLSFCLIGLIAKAQNPKMAVISFDANGADLKTKELTELLRIEISKHKKYEMIDRYEIKEILTKETIKVDECLSKTCLITSGKKLDVNWTVSGSADKLGDALFIRIRLVNIESKAIEKEVVKEFLNIPDKVNTMISICVNELMGIENDKVIVNSLSNRDSYESAINNPYYQKLSLSGPRMGYAFFTGETAEIIKKPTHQGGYDAAPAFFQMGYQFEKQYLNEGKWQALFEFIPMVSGINEGLLIPSLTIMNGIRSNKTGLEFALGPSVNVVNMTKKYDLNGTWVRSEDSPNVFGLPEVNKMDSRGLPNIKTYVVFAAGYSLKSGKLNIPINLFVIPSKGNLRYGFSFGFNARN